MNELLLFDGCGSEAALLTVAVFVMLPPDAWTKYVAKIVVDWCGPSAAIVQGKAVVQAPELEMKVRPAGVGSATVMFVALNALVLLTPTWNVITLDEFAFAGPLFCTSRSMLPPVATGVVAVDELFAPFESLVELLTVAVLLIELPL